MCLCIRDPDYQSELISFIGRGLTVSLHLFRLQHFTLIHMLACGEMALSVQAAVESDMHMHWHGIYVLFFVLFGFFVYMCVCN